MHPKRQVTATSPLEGLNWLQRTITSFYVRFLYCLPNNTVQKLSTRPEVSKLPIFLVSSGPYYLGDSTLLDLSFILTTLVLRRINVKFTVKTSFCVSQNHFQNAFFTKQNIPIFPRVVKRIHSSFIRKPTNPSEVQLFLPIIQDIRLIFTTSWLHIKSLSTNVASQHLQPLYVRTAVVLPLSILLFSPSHLYYLVLMSCFTKISLQKKSILFFDRITKKFR